MARLFHSTPVHLRLTPLMLLCSLAGSLLIANTTHAIAWDAGRIIDDTIFTNQNTMSTSSIQNFLNSKVPTCDTWGTQPSEFGGGTREQWGTAHGNPPPYTCLKDYIDGGKSSAQIIFDTAQAYQINPQVLITLLQKEQSLVTDTWPLASQYRSATGYACGDTSACESAYYGLTNQITWSAKMFRAIMNASPGWYTPYILGNNTVYFNPGPYDNANHKYYGRFGDRADIEYCGSTTVNISNRATQALYNYTPYQPNPAALAAGYGSAPPCGAYGNRNFVLYFNDWFGATTNDNLKYSVIQGPNSSALYLQTSAGKYYIPSGAFMKSWRIDTLPIQQVSQAYLDNLTTGPNVGNLLKDDWNNFFVVEDGKLHYVRDLAYLTLWNISPDSAVRSLGLAYTLKSDSWLGRFVSDTTQTNGPTWLIDKGQKHLIADKSLLYQWRYTPDQITPVSTSFLDSIPTNPNNVTTLASTGSISYVVDSGRKLGFDNDNIKNAYYGFGTSVSYDPTTLSFLPTEKVNQFIVNSSTGQWFMLEGGKKHYIESGNLAELWGKSSNIPPTSLSDTLVSTLPDAGNLTNVVQTASPSMYWVIDKDKHYIRDSATANAWIRPGSTPPVYSTQSLNTLPSGSDATTTINATGSPYFYTMDAGTKHYMMSSNARSAWGGAIMTISRVLLDRVPEGPFINYTVKNVTGNAFLIMNNVSYPIDPAYYGAWGITNTTPVVADSTVSRYTSSGLVLRSFVRINNSPYIMAGGNKTPITIHSDAYQPDRMNQTILPNDYFPTNSEATFLIKSTDTQDNRIWLISGGKKYLFNSFAAYVSYGFLSRGILITALNPETLSLIPNAPETPGLFIRTETSGVKFINFGVSLGFPDGNTLTNAIGSAPILVVSDSIFNVFPLTDSVSRIIKDDSGKLYLLENGKKRWITNGKAYDAYKNYRVTYLYGTTISLIPDGPTIN